MDNNVGYEIIDSTNQQFFAVWARMSNWLATFENSSVHTLQFSMESGHNAIKVNSIPDGESIELIGSSLRTIQLSKTRIVRINTSDNSI